MKFTIPPIGDEPFVAIIYGPDTQYLILPCSAMTEDELSNVHIVDTAGEDLAILRNGFEVMLISSAFMDESATPSAMTDMVVELKKMMGDAE